MKLFRAQEILSAADKITVELDGVSVWIDSVDPESSTAKIHVEDRPGEARVVPVDELQEVE